MDEKTANQGSPKKKANSG